MAELPGVYISGSRASLLGLASAIREAAETSGSIVEIRQFVMGPMKADTRTLVFDNHDMENRDDLKPGTLIVATDDE